jgi:hypothetical protein
MVIVLRDKIQMIQKSHGLLQTRVQFGLCKQSRLKLSWAIQQAWPLGAELGQNLF